MKALILAPFAERSLERLREQLDVTYEPWTDKQRTHDPKKLAARIHKEAFTIVVVEGDILLAEAFAAPSLRLVGVCRSGLNLVDVDAATKHGIAITHTPARNAAAVAEFTIGLMLALARHLPAAHNYVTGGGWTNPFDAYLRFQGREISKSVVGVVGFGQMGAETARRARCLGARVIAFDPYASQRRARAMGVRLVSLPALLRRADFVSLHTARTPETAQLIDGPALDLMKPTAYLISIGANNVLDDEALVERLRSRRIAGAALDVFAGYMLSTSSPYLELDNVILTPHLGGATGETITRHSRMIVEDIERFLRGEQLRRLANPEMLSVATRGG